MPFVLPGQRTWELSRDDNGHREYEITFRVQMDSPLQGPALAMQTAGLPVFGSWWVIDEDADFWAWCRWNAKVKPVYENEPNLHFDVTFTFSTKPPDADDRACSETHVEDPLLEPPKINGSFVVYSEEKSFNRFGDPIINSAFERIYGPQVEFDANRLQVKIEMNVPTLDLVALGAMANTVNDAPLWGYPARCIKLSEIEWERRYYGTCYVYYTLHLTFDCRPDTFDRDITDEGTKVLNGHWDAKTGAWVLNNINGAPPNPDNPQHFIKWKDLNGENMKGLLNGGGLPAGVKIGTGTDASVYYVSLQDNNVSTPPGGSWLTVLAPISRGVTVWSNHEAYRTGQIVVVFFEPWSSLEGDYFLCISSVEASGVAPGNPNNTLWKNFWLGIAPDFTFTSKGIYESGQSYDEGDYVSFQESTVEGFIHVEYYGESDFTQLGIPLVL